jgi:hypothetical protein
MADGTGGMPPPNHGRPAGQGGAGPGGGAGGASSFPDMAADWITIWQSELAAMATDRELQEGWLRMVDLWAQAAQSMTRLMPRAPGGHDGSGGRAGSAAAAGAAAVMAAPDARDAAIRHLAERVDELERQLASLGGARSGAGSGD